MKNLLIFLFSLSLVSCSQFGTRKPASVIEAFSIGDVKSSMLSPQEFQEQNGNVWVLMDGQDVSGSEYELLTSFSKVPDARGKFFRMNNNGAKCEDATNCVFDPDSRTLGSFQQDSFQGHRHSWTNQGGGGNGVKGTSASASNISNAPIGPMNITEQSGFGSPRYTSETRPRNISINFYIKVNSCSSVEGLCR